MFGKFIFRLGLPRAMLDYFIAEVGAHCIRDQSFFFPDITDLDLHYILIQE